MTLTKHTNKWNLLGSDSRYFIITGGRGSGKSFEVARFLTLISRLKPNERILFTRKTLTSAHLSIIPEFVQKIELLGLQNDFHITSQEIICKVSNSEILFRGLTSSSNDNTANLKSLSGINNWILDEAEELTDEKKFDTIDFSIRQKDRQNRVICILNPTTKEHFLYDKFFIKRGVNEGFTGTIGDTTYIHSTYLDNLDNLSQSFIDGAERLKLNNESKYNHIMLGGWLDKAEGVVLTNWSYGEFNPDNLQTYFGQDYGFSSDPTTLIEVAIDKKKKKIYAKEHLYKVGLNTSQIAEINKKICGQKLIVGDSAEPRLISELQSVSNIIPAVKGQGSITAGVMILQDYEIVVEANSINLVKELNNWCYADKGSQTYLDKLNHLIDALRYIVYYILRNDGSLADIR